MKKNVYLLILVLLGLSSCKDYLDRKNLDTFDESNFWTSEGNMRLYAQGAYTAYFTGYGSGYTWGNYFTEVPGPMSIVPVLSGPKILLLQAMVGHSPTSEEQM